MNEFVVAKKVKANELLIRAADEIANRGVSRGSCRGPDGSVDAWGALCLAAGAKYENLDNHVDDAYDYVPHGHIAALMSSYRLASAAVGHDIAEWSDTATKEQVAWLFQRLAHQVEAVFIPLDEPA